MENPMAFKNGTAVRGKPWDCAVFALLKTAEVQLSCRSILASPGNRVAWYLSDRKGALTR